MGFSFSVSFIKKAGLILILKDIESALDRGVKGKMITSTYQNFTDIGSLKILHEFTKRYDNFECHIDHNSFVDKGFHTKGYLFDYKDHQAIIIGSSNLTRYALLKNIEWNIYYLGKKQSHTVNELAIEYQMLWEQTKPVTQELIDDYTNQLEYAIEKWDMDYYSHYTKIMPNFMQRKALKELRRYRDQGVDKALVVAATGSGKTHLAAFDARNFGAKRLLFVVHRESILVDAIKTFRTIFGSDMTCGMLTGDIKEYDCDFLFATNLTLSRNLDLFDSKEFDYMVVDEVHHGTASTYQRIINYFRPEFLLGLTATPDRMDQLDVYDIFDKNVPYDLRIRDAILHELIVPFEYYGIRDVLVNYDQSDTRALVNEIASFEHSEFIAAEIKKHMPTGKLKALAFCKTVDHARRMSENISMFDFTTRHLTGTNDTGERIRAFKDLQDDSHPLQIIFTVDILNEGVDIPAVNMVLFLRPTDSATIFIQQLGRGLRKYPNKPFLTVLDFIGNSYRRSVQVVRALGSLSRSSIIEKGLLVDLLREDFQSLDIPGVKIHFDALSKEQIDQYIEKTNFNLFEYLKTDYYNFKRYIKSKDYPLHIDYLDHELAPDLMRFIKSKIRNKKSRSYYVFLKQIGEEVPFFSDEQVDFINDLSDFLPLIRSYEFEIIQHLIVHGNLSRHQLVEYCKNPDQRFKEDQFDNALESLQKSYVTRLDDPQKGLFYQLGVDRTHEQFIAHVNDLIDYGLSRYDEEFGDFEGPFKLYGNYTTNQFMMALCEPVRMFVKGTKITEDGTVYILANLKKHSSQLEHLKYRDEFLDRKTFQWESETNTTMTNDHGLIHSKIAHLFIRKMKEEDGITLPYTYVGTGKLTNPRVSDNPKQTLLFDMILDVPLPEHLKFDFNLKKGFQDEETD